MPYARFFGALAIAAGLARMVMSFFPWREGDGALEAAALAIDLGLLFGLTGFWVSNAKALGVPGLLTYLIAASGIALIAGPDGQFLRFDIYQTGVLIIGLGLALMSLTIIARRLQASPAGYAWLLSGGAFAVGRWIGRPDEAFIAAGVFFGAGFVLAGWSLLRAKLGSD